MSSCFLTAIWWPSEISTPQIPKLRITALKWWCVTIAEIQGPRFKWQPSQNLSARHLAKIASSSVSRFTFWFMSCLVISCFYFEITTLSSEYPLVSGTLPFLLCQVSDCFPWFPKCFHLFPLVPRVQIVCVSLCPVPVCCVSSTSLILAFLIHSHRILEPAVSDPPAEQYPCFVVIYSIALVFTSR